MLHSEPSFAIYNTNEGLQEENENQDFDMEKLVKSDGQLVRSVTIGDRIEALGSDEFSFEKTSMGLIQEDDNEEEDDDNKEEDEPASTHMYLAAGLGVDGNGFDGDVTDFAPKSFVESGDVGEYYRRMLREEPSSPLLLRNYARFLQSQGDISGAEEYYFRATLADPKDGEILMQYAKLVWELHRDRDKALSYFERAASAASEDSHVLAAYASFLWEIEESEEEDSSPNTKTLIEESGNQADVQNSVVEELERPVSPSLNLAAGLGMDAAGFGVGISTVDYAAASLADNGNVEEYYKRMVEENPCNPLFLRNYAEFLCQSKGDKKGAEEYYSRALLADPSDGEIISQYAKLVWQLHHDKDKASSYFERAVHASPESSDVLAAYARFLWEAEEDEGDDITQANHDQVSNLEGAMTTTSA